MQTSAPGVVSEEMAKTALRAIDVFGLLTSPGYLQLDLDLPFGGGNFGVFEHVVHELCHAALLGIWPETKTAVAIAIMLDGMAPAARIGNEAQTFAVEIGVLQAFGLIAGDYDSPDEGDRVHIDDMFDAATIQGCTREQVEAWVGHVPVCVDKVIGWLKTDGFPESLLPEE